MNSNDSFAEFIPRLREFIQDSLAPRVRAAGADTFVSCNDRFAHLAIELFALQFNNNSAYRRICEARGVSPITVSDWINIPAVPTSAFKELELTCLPKEDRPAVFHSSRTTATVPSRHFHNSASLALYEDSLLAWFERSTLQNTTPAHCRLAILTPPPSQACHSSLVHMFETIRRRHEWVAANYLGSVGGDGEWSLDMEIITRQLRDAETQREPVIVLGTAFSFVHLTEHLAGRGVRLELPFGSWVLETGGYKGRSRNLPKSELYALITKWLGVFGSHIISEYGMSELSSQAYDLQVERGSLRRVFRFPPWARALIVSPETGKEVSEGETGLVRVFDLANAYSVMAVQTEDLGVRRSGGFELIGRTATAEPRGCSLMAA